MIKIMKETVFCISLDKNVERVRKYQKNHKVHNVLLDFLYTPKNLRMELRGNPFPFYMRSILLPLDYFS